MTNRSICIWISILRSALSCLSGREIPVSILCLLSGVLTILSLRRCCSLPIWSSGSFSIVFIFLARSIRSTSIAQRRCTSALSWGSSGRPSTTWIMSVWHVITVYLACMASVIMSIGGSIAILCAHSYTTRIEILLEIFWCPIWYFVWLEFITIESGLATCYLFWL